MNLQTVKTCGTKALYALRRFFGSEQCMLAEFLAASLFFVFGQEVAGVVTFVYLISAMLLVCDDTLPTFTPFLMIGLIVLKMYDSFDTFMALKWVMGVPAVLGIAGHFALYRRKPVAGALTKGYAVLGAALLLGGMFSISAKDYFSGTSLYYMLGLGFGMLALYAVLAPHVNPHRSYDVKIKLALSALYVGALAVVIVAAQYILNADMLKDGAAFSQQKLSSLSNNLSTNVLLLMPFAFYLSTKRKGYAGGVYFVFGLLEALAAVASLSRGGIMFVGAMTVACVVVTIKADKQSRLRDVICLLAVLAVAGAAVGVFFPTVKGLFANGIVASSKKTLVILAAVVAVTVVATLYFYYVFTLTDKSAKRAHVIFIASAFAVCAVAFVSVWPKIKDTLVLMDGYRGNMMKIAVDNFATYPIFGTGIGYTGLRGVYENKTGMFGCYHCLPVQVVGSMGLVGVAAYIYMLKARLTLLTKTAARDKGFATAVFFAYAGIVAMSLVNPGIFCPVVYGLQLAVYFLIAEQTAESPAK